jgi:hypothetical protein
MRFRGRKRWEWHRICISRRRLGKLHGLGGLVLCRDRGWGRMRGNHALAGAIAGPFRIHNVQSINRRFERSFWPYAAVLGEEGGGGAEG